MAEEFARYGVYFTPEPGALADFGAAWLGWDCAQGAAVPHPKIAGLPVAEITATPRKYGFHGTLKPPMRLSADTDAAGLRARLQEVCAGLAPFELDGLRVARLGKFVALTPVGDVSALRDLAAGLVVALDPFRAPPSEAELARRRKSGLSAPQEALLARWGYPYVMGEFRFHMTLTGPVSTETAEAVRAALSPRFADLLPGSLPIADVTLVGEGADGRFRQVARVPLGD